VVAPIPARVIVPGPRRPVRPPAHQHDRRVPRVCPGHRAGRDRRGAFPLELARQTDLGEYAGWLDSERIVGNLHRAYADLGAADAEVDLLTALTDMVAYNGGRPLSCFA
jgi:cyclase